MQNESARSVAVTEHAVVIAGGGPTGLMLAAELALARVDVAIVERRPDQELAGSRAGGLHSRTIEVLDQRGIADRFLAEGQVAQVAGFAATRLDISDFPTRHNYGLALRQGHIERILVGWVSELKVPISYGVAVTGFAQDAAWSAKQPASTSPGGIRRRATSSPKSRWPRSRRWASTIPPPAPMPSAEGSTRSGTGRS